MHDWINHAALGIVRVLSTSFDPFIPPNLDHRPKVFGIGFHKTGTSTLGRALRTLGYRVQKGRAFNHPRKPSIPEPVTLDKVWDLVRPMIPLYGAFEDNPWPLLFQHVDQAYPGSRFVFTYRDSDRWIRSALRYFGAKTNATHDLLYERPKFRIAGNEDIALARYERHNMEVLDYFHNRPGDILQWNLEADPRWEPLCEFLGCPVPERHFPHANHASGRKRVPADTAAAA
ncbi:MAG: sulfotransferase [Planctomycetaceae bacterium]